MAFDEDLAACVREVLAGLAPEAGEVKMFGGLAFMVNTHMACGLIGDDLTVRVGPDAHNDALAQGASEMDFTGRTMHGMIVVPGPAQGDPNQLTLWVEQGVQYARTQPPKKLKKPKVRTHNK